MRFVPYSDSDGQLNAGWTIVMASFGLAAVAASVYLVLVLEILKFSRWRARQLRREELSDSDIEAEIVREVETGEFDALQQPR